jgi:ornithine cyclodeaminase/alanine dehydrogenase-like protein (mu-crystallin family)
MIFTQNLNSTLKAGPIVAAVAQHVPVHDKIVELGQILAGKERGVSFKEWRQGRGHHDGFVIYNSVGLGIQDAAVVEFLLDHHKQ